MNIYKKCTAEPYSVLVIDTNLPSDNFQVSNRIFQRKYKN